MTKSIDEIADEMLPEVVDQIPEFADMEKSQLIMYHHDLGRHIRNRFGLWEHKWEPELVDGVDMSKEHPDSISMRVIERIHEKLNNKDLK